MGMIAAHLKRLKEHNEQVQEGSQWIEPPGHVVLRVPTLQEHHSVPSTPMVQQRFSFAGAWRNAAMGQDWLGVEDMKSVWLDPVIQKQLSRRREHEDSSVLTAYPLGRLSLFGIDLIGSNESYLVWSDQGGVEARVVVYSGGHHTHEFDDLQTYFRWLVESFK